jgi:pimeloyl-ACP methyl ester carboxylesterase
MIVARARAGGGEHVPWGSVSTPPFVTLPAGVSAGRLETSRGSFAILEAGQPTAPTALFVPGFTGSKEDFIAILEPIAATGRHVVAVDQRGQYESVGPADDERPYTLPELALDLRAMVAALGGQVHIVGHSFGGFVGRVAVLDDPSIASSFVLLGSGPSALVGDIVGQVRVMQDLLRASGAAMVWQAMRALDEALGRPEPAAAEVREFVERRFHANSPAALLAMAEALLVEEDRVAELAALPLPMLVAYGTDEDRWPGATQIEMARRLGVRCAEIPAAGHSPAVDNPRHTVELLTEFWTNVDASALTRVRA